MIVEPLSGDQIEAALDDLARLRIAVFRAFPYLYDGDMTYERRYLQSYRQNPRTVLAVARDGDKIVGAATGMPLSDHADAAQLTGPMPDPDQVFYCAESVLLPEYRGYGIGHKFFDLREAHARSLGLTKSAFCSVIRPDTHPQRPDGYANLHPFWENRGYAPLDGVTASFGWKDLGESEETQKTLQFWMRDL
jgi:GNAT superfamily N-acetyltransferase